MIVIADIHLGKVQDTIEKNGYPSRAIDATNRMKEAVQVAKSFDEPLILAGDIFDSTHPSPWMIELLMSVLHDAHYSHVPVFIIPGNHDCGVQFHSMTYMSDVFPNVRIIDNPEIIEIDESTVLFLPHVTRQRMESIVEDYGSYSAYVQAMLHARKKQTPIDIIIGHAHVTGAKNASEIEIESGDALHFDTSEYPRFKLAVFGHIHKPQTLKKDKILYTGPVVTNSFDEANDAKFMVRILDSGEGFQYIEFKTAVTEYVQVIIDLVTKDTVNLEKSRVKKLVNGKLVKLSIYARDPMQIDLQHLKSVFDEYGKVVRVESVITDDIAEIDQNIVDDVFSDIDFLEVFKSWLESKDVPAEIAKLSKSIARDIIAEAEDAERIITE